MKDENKTLSKEELNLIAEADCYMEEVNRDPDVVNAEPPKEAYDELMAKIRKREEEKELIRLGKLYRKKRCLRKYFILPAAMVRALALGITSFGGGEKIVEIFRSNKLGREQTQVNTSGEVDPLENITEEEVYQKIEDEYGFYPVVMEYRPKGVNFLRSKFNNMTQEILLEYGSENEIKIISFIYPNYRGKSQAMDFEDEVIIRKTLTVQNVDILLKEYRMEEDLEKQITAEYEYKGVWYYHIFLDMEWGKVEKIIKFLNF